MPHNTLIYLHSWHHIYIHSLANVVILTAFVAGKTNMHLPKRYTLGKSPKQPDPEYFCNAEEVTCQENTTHLIHSGHVP